MDDPSREIDGMDERGSHAASSEDALREGLRRDFAPPAFPEDEIEARIRASVARRRQRTPRGDRPAPPRWSGGTAQAVLAAAASLVLFIGGVEYGRRTAVPPPAASAPGPEVVAPVEQAVSLPLSIQSAGTRYVAALARFSGQSDALAAEERQVAREVALAALYGATVELLREAGEDDVLSLVAEMVAARRGITVGDEPPPGRRF